MIPYSLDRRGRWQFRRHGSKARGRATSVIGYSISIFGDGDAAGGLSPEY